MKQHLLFLIYIACTALWIPTADASDGPGEHSVLVIYDGVEDPSVEAPDSSATQTFIQELQISFDKQRVHGARRRAFDPELEWAGYDDYRLMQKLYAVALLKDASAVIGLFGAPSDSQAGTDTAAQPSATRPQPTTNLYLVVIGREGAVGRKEAVVLSEDNAADLSLTIEELTDQGWAHLENPTARPPRSKKGDTSGWRALAMPAEFRGPELEKPQPVPPPAPPAKAPPIATCFANTLGMARTGIYKDIGPSLYVGGALDSGCTIHRSWHISGGLEILTGLFSFTGEDRQEAFHLAPRVNVGPTFASKSVEFAPFVRLTSGITRYDLSFPETVNKVVWRWSPRAVLGVAFSFRLSTVFSLYTEVNAGWNIVRDTFNAPHLETTILRTPLFDAGLALGFRWNFTQGN